MSQLRGVIVYKNPPDVMARELKPAVKEGLFTAVVYWHRRFLPRHFTVLGERLYGYKPRAGQDEPAMVPRGKNGRMVLNRKYWHLKRRRKGHVRPLVWSGTLERTALAAIRVSGSHKQARGVLSLVPRYAYQYRKDLNQPDKAAELTRTTQSEVEELGQRMRGELLRRLAANRTTRTRRIA